jgi:hypothetical protein
VTDQLIALMAITFGAAIVNGALGYGFSSITVPLALLFMTNRVLNPAFVASLREKAQHGDPNASFDTSVDKVTADLAELDKTLADAQKGLDKLNSNALPADMGAMLVILVPGTPKADGDLSPAGIMRYIDQRRSYWQGERAKYVDHMNSIQRQLDPANMAHDAKTWDIRDVRQMYFEAMKWALGLTDATLAPHPMR